jgi:hypothetical protein
VRQNVGGRPRAGSSAQQRQLVRDGRRAAEVRGVDAGGVGLDRRARRVAEARQVPSRRAVQADAAREAVGGQAPRPDQLGQRAAPDAQQRLELEAAVLRVAEALAEPHVVLAAGAHVGHPEAIAGDDHVALEAADGQPPGEPRSTRAERQAQGARPGASRAMVRHRRDGARGAVQRSGHRRGP